MRDCADTFTVRLLSDITVGHKGPSFADTKLRLDVGVFKLAYIPRPEANGFDLTVVRLMVTDDRGDWYETILELTAYFDGVRHVHFLSEEGRDEDFRGYDNYPCIASYIKLFEAIRKLELSYCSEAK